ncbi:MAG: hypothetical protein K8R59_02130 [Thermoanaerobaculales bacterium]|nr:hypothetical protein [Thermoanaerobaculales bacterium]
MVDAIRLETHFTAGAQHIAGKIACMNLNQDGDSDEGTKFMEQSTLFGSAVLWPRTVEPSDIDMPEDFNAIGGTAVLTVKIGGAPLAKAGAAIVNFYTTAGQTITPVGSGLIDATGMVQAAVTGEPTHCHIHGHNLLPQSFDLTAQDDGRLNLDHSAYACSSTAGIRVADANVPLSSEFVIDTLSVEVSAGGSPVEIVLTETDVNTGFYDGTVVLGDELIVADDDTLVVTYEDADTGAGPQTKTATATIDCSPPGIEAVEAATDHESLTITYFTDEPGTTLVRWGTTVPPTNVVSDGALIDGTHSMTIEDLNPCQTIFFEVGSTDAVGNTTIDTNGGAWYSADTLGWAVYFEETMDTDPAWTIDNGGFSSAEGWAFGQPTGQGQDGYGGPDPTSGHTDENVYGINISGDAPAYAGENELTLTTPSIDLTEATTVQLSYWRWLGVEDDRFDHARVRLSVDGGDWNILWENGLTTIDEFSWSEHVFDITGAAAGHADVRVQWTYGESDSGWQYAGWNIDDVRIEGPTACDGLNSVFADDFESGNCSQWSAEVAGE